MDIMLKFQWCMHHDTPGERVLALVRVFPNTPWWVASRIAEGYHHIHRVGPHRLIVNT